MREIEERQKTFGFKWLGWPNFLGAIAVFALLWLMFWWISGGRHISELWP